VDGHGQVDEKAEELDEDRAQPVGQLVLQPPGATDGVNARVTTSRWSALTQQSNQSTGVFNAVTVAGVLTRLRIDELRIRRSIAFKISSNPE
jgi:hypothetical protein